MHKNWFVRRQVPVRALALAALAVVGAGCTGSVTGGEPPTGSGGNSPVGSGGNSPVGGSVGNTGGSGPSAHAGGGPAVVGSGGAAVGGMGGVPAGTGGQPAVHATPGHEFECKPGETTVPGRNLVRRLTTREYANTVQAILKVTVAPTDLPAETSTSGFETDANALVVSFERITAMESLATATAAKITDPAAFVARFATCTTMTAACQTMFIDNLGRKMFRSPVQPQERTALLALYAAAQTEGATFPEASMLIVRSMLQAPRFLYRTEKERGDGTVQPLSDYELAARLSYAVWQSPPDDLLDAAVAAGKLKDTAGLTAELERMLKDPRAYVTAAEFFSDWVDLRRMDNLQRDAGMFPGFDNALNADMKAEAEAMFQHVWQNNLPLTALYGLQKTTVSRALAEHYKLPNPVNGVSTYDLTGTPRAGMLTQGALAAIGGELSSTVVRGLFILENVVCSEITPPPLGLDTSNPPRPAPSISRRTISEQRVNAGACGGCHSQMERPVWGLVRFNATGAYSEMDEFGNPLPSDGAVIFPGDATMRSYANAVELGKVLAGHERTRDCATIKVVQYTMGREPAKTEACALSTARQTIASSPGTYVDMLRALAQSDMFRRIKTQTE